MNCLPQIHMYQTICKVMRAFETLISNCNFVASLKVWHINKVLILFNYYARINFANGLVHVFEVAICYNQPQSQ